MVELFLSLNKIDGKTKIFFHLFSCVFFRLFGKSIKMLVHIVMFMCKYSGSFNVGFQENTFKFFDSTHV